MKCFVDWSRDIHHDQMTDNTSQLLLLLLLWQLPFYGQYTGQLALASITVKNWRVLLEQSFTARMSLMKATSAIELGRRR